jgi:precorrin-6Y C5,15-methyltransferase (decarboxylating)
MVSSWLTIIGIGEDGLSSITDASRKAIMQAATVFGGARHLALVDVGARGRAWPVPFDASVVLACRGQPTVVLASGDPFWHGVGSLLAERLDRNEWIAHPAPSTFSLAASRLGWRLEAVTCLGLHAAPFERLIPYLSQDARIICLVRDGQAAIDLAAWLTTHGWGTSQMSTLAALGGPNERVTLHQADRYAGDPTASLVTVALDIKGPNGLPRSSGVADDLFIHDGQITKRPVRALALSSLAPRAGEGLWDIGAGSGSISIEWALHGGLATSIETRGDRAANIRANAAAFGVTDSVTVIEGSAPDILSDLPAPQAVFFGGGLNATTFDAVWSRLSTGARLVAHAVTLETEALLTELHQRHGGELIRIEISHAGQLGRYRSWEPARPIAQWSVVKQSGGDQ